ncbi:hypothetical protein TNCV_274621 [Trichonephila clavipes]|nr:hypothetical protein TNCV_274621 [Trichonephila clavipes]
MEGEPYTQNTNTTYNDTLSAMSEKVRVADSSLAGNKNSPLNQDLLFSKKSQQLYDKNTSLMPLKTNFKPNKNEESNHQMSRINPNRDNSDKKYNNLTVSATFSDIMTETSNKIFENEEVTEVIKKVVEWKDKWLEEQQKMTTSFSCCIIDDAAQCIEMEILQLLALDINKLILVGDPLQLPADIFSKTAASLGCGRSLFERFI